MGIRQTSWITFGGEPAAGRPVPQLIIEGGGILTREQEASVARAYQQFKLETAPSASPSQVAHRTLPDGSALRMVSINGCDQVFVSPVPSGGPQPIDIAGYLVLPRDATNTSGWDKSGKPDSARAYLPTSKAVSSPPPKTELHVKLQAGAVDWRGSKGVILSYDHNGSNRYSTDRWNFVFITGIGSDPDSSSHGLYYKGTKINTSIGVQAAAVFEGHLIVIGHTTINACVSPIGHIEASLAQGRFVSEVTPTWTTVAITGTVSTAKRASAWHFKPDGSRAGAAYVYSSLGLDTWSWTRMRTEAVPMCKRTLDFAIASGVVTATVSDTVFTTEPIGLFNGASYATTRATAQGGTFKGKRLWGIDYAADGTEIEVTFERAGTCTAVDGDASAWTQHWGVYANGAAIFEANYSYVDTGESSSEYVCPQSIDARTRSAVVEYLTLGNSAPSAQSDRTVWFTQLLHFPGGVPKDVHVDPFDIIESEVRVFFGGAVVQTHAGTIDSSRIPPLYGAYQPDPRVGHAFALKGSVSGSYNFGNLYAHAYPQIGGFNQENVYEQLFTDNSGDNRAAATALNRYPNQVSDTLSKCCFVYGELFVGIWSWGILSNSSADDLTSTVYGGATITTPPFTVADQLNRYTTMNPAGSTYYLQKGLAMRGAQELHFVAHGSDVCMALYQDVVRSIRVTAGGSGTTDIGQDYFGVIYTRPDTLSGWTASDLLATLNAKVTADGNSPDADTFHFDPVRLV